MQTIVSDTTTLIILSKIDRYDLLKNLFNKVYLPSSVAKEINAKSNGIKNFLSKDEALSILDEIKSMKFRIFAKLEEEFKKILFSKHFF